MYIRQRLLFENEMYKDLNPNLLANVKLELWKSAYFIKDKLFELYKRGKLAAKK
jgi:hypothetical protein